jgi:glyoxylase-like metal-dependent hydrolase (beta-lactamase superfamily II)
VPLEARRHVDANGVDVIPTPGHSDGSTCYLVSGVDGEKYLFTGDTMFPTGDGRWSTFLVPGRGSAEELRSSLELLGTLRPDIVISSAFGGETAIEEVGTDRWQECIAEALASVPS